MSKAAACVRGWLRNRSRPRLTRGLPAILVLLLTSVALVAVWRGPSGLAGQATPPLHACHRPAPGSAVAEPRELRSQNGVLQVDLAIHDQQQPDGTVRYCYTMPDGTVSPTLRLHPGDLLILHFKNDLTAFEKTVAGAAGQAPPGAGPIPAPICRAGQHPHHGEPIMRVSSNVHFHGLTVPPVYHQDDVLTTLAQPDEPAFEYRLRIPDDEPPGLYWYHPHVHGYSTDQVLGGASGALIIEGIERANPALAGLPERVLVIRDQDLLNPNAPPSKFEPVVGKNLVENDGDAVNNGTGSGKPAKDLSVNFVPVPYPDYPPASIAMKPHERQLWRVLNASAITYLNLAVLFGHAAQRLGVVAIDGVPINISGSQAPSIQEVDHIGVPPGSRVEFVVNGPPAGVPALLVTRTVDTGPGGENDPNRALASIVASPDAAEPDSRLPANPQPLASPTLPWIGTVAPSRIRRLYFSEKLQNPNDPASATEFYLTEEGKTPAAFDPTSTVPDIVVRQGDVEDWIIENRSMELHNFHIHQLHFELVDWNGIPVNEPFTRDTVNVPYYNGHTLGYPSVRIRMDFRDPNIVGLFVYHCHVLEHEDGGMMGRIRVEPAIAKVSTAEPNQQTKGVP
jgi:FtsP/CotA-like multicopper oxidase with cupredoxin domain